MRLRALWRRKELEADMQEEMRFHLEMEAERLMREEGLDAQEARRQARIRFGNLEKYKEEGRDARGWQWLDALLLDVRFAARMLVKHRGLTLVGGVAMAVAIAIGATSFEVMTEVLNPALPLDEGDRIVSVEHAPPAWREEITTIESLAAFRTIHRTLESSETVKVAEITATGFSVARTAPLIGRAFTSDDERVVVIGHDAWQSRFNGDRQIVGRTIRLGGVPHTIAGVMPQGFRFPVDHQFWIPLRATVPASELRVFGRLKHGVTIEDAQAELRTIAQRTAMQERPAVLPFTHAQLDLTDPGLLQLLRIAQLFIGAISFVVAVNLAILFYARTVTRLGELAVRTALGASRARILAQLFIEAFALSASGAVAGLLLAHVALQRMKKLLPANGSVPFWIDLDLSFTTIIYALVLAALAAVIIGVLPGLRATGNNLHVHLHELSSRAGMRLGTVWTTLVVAQVAIAVAVLPLAVYLSWRVVRLEVTGAGFSAERLVVGTIINDDNDAAEVISRVQSEAGVSAVTYSSSVPGFASDQQIEFEDGSIHETAALDVDVELFDVYGIEMLAGRALQTGDTNAVVVNRTFAQKFLPDRNPLGVRLRKAQTKEWTQIVGVVRDFPAFSASPASDGTPTVYRPIALGSAPYVVLTVRFDHGIPDGFPDRLRAIGASIDPALQLRRVAPLTKFYDEVRSFWRSLAWAIALVTASVMLLSAAGIYALLSFTVAQRTREIGIRAALGAHPRQLLLSIFGRAMRQIALGLLVGSLLSGALFFAADFGAARSVGLLLAVAALMLITGVVAAVVPARHSLRIQPFDALRT